MDKDQEIAALRALLAQRDAALAEQSAALVERDARLSRQGRELAAVEGTVARLQRELARLKQQVLGTTRERFEPSAAQLALWGAERPPAKEPTPRPKRRGRPHGRRKPAAELPEEVVTCTVPEDAVCTECGDPLKTFGEDEAERLEYVPGYFRRLRILREKCACPAHPAAGVVTAPQPAFIIDRGLPGNGLVAKILVDKYADHIPLDRQVRRARRQGVDLSLSTVCDWVQRAAQPASVLVRAMLAELTAGSWLQTDATGFKVLEGSRNKPHRGHLYTWANTDRVVYTYAREGTGDHPAGVLADFRGTLVADGGSAFNQAASKPGVVRAGCWAHARRKFWEARDTDPRHVHHALETIREVFQLERVYRDLGPAERAQRRRATTWPIIDAFRAWCQAIAMAEPPKSPLAKAANYVLRQWDTLVVFIDNGDIPAHNNLSELLLRQPVVGRKNWLFAGSEGGAQTAAVWFSLIGSCMVNAIDPWLYLNDVLPRLNDWPAQRVLELEPAAWRQQRLSQRA